MRVLANELTPSALGPARCWQQAMAPQDGTHGVVRAATAELEEFALDTPDPHLGFSPARRRISS